MSLTPKNWDSFQHYRDRSPAWIKLHRGLLDNREYHQLDPLAAKCLPLIWLIASERDGIVPEADELAFRLRIQEAQCEAIIKDLEEHGFLVEGNAKPVERGATLAQRIAKGNGFGNRHISDVVKREIWIRDDGKCRQCGSSERIEYDHIVPISKGGESGLDNIQLLCRPCNRSKRTRLATPAQPLRSLEKERENKKELEKEKDIRAVASATRTKSDEAFDELWKARPRRKGADPKQPARKLFLAFVKRGVDTSEIVAGARKWAAADADKIGTEFIPQTVKWLRDERWRDYLETISETTGPPKPPDPSMPSDEELRRKYGAKPDDLHGRAPSESGGIRGASGKVREGPGSGGNESLSHHQARIGGMASMGTVLSGISGLRALGDASSEVRREQADDGPKSMA